jgi:hypothetical protein
MKTSLNGNLILKPYKKTRELKQKEITTGFITTANKIGVEYLELLVDSLIEIGNNNKCLDKGTKIYFKEETLYNAAWTKRVFENKDFPEGFIIAPIKDAVFIEDNND